MSREFALYLYLAAVVSPLAFWAILARYARRRSDRLRPLLPWLTVLAWVLWACAIVLPLLSLIGKLPRAWLLVVPFYLGINLIRGWIKQRVDPPTKESDGWWPAPKNP